MPKRKHFPRLPSGYGSVRYLGPNRRLPYAVHPPASDRTETGRYIRPKALCYVPDWYTGFAVLSAWHAGTYRPGDELMYAKEVHDTAGNLDGICKRLIRNYAVIAHSDAPDLRPTLSEVYLLWYDWKYGENAAKRLSDASRASARIAYKHLEEFHDRPLDDITLSDWQTWLNSQPGSRSTVTNILNLIKQLYRFALPRDLCTRDIGPYLVVPATPEPRHGKPFSDVELAQMWARKNSEVSEFLLIMCYSGFRISAYTDMEINLTEGYFKGGVKTASSKNRIVPIHPAILPLVTKRLERYGSMLPDGTQAFRKQMELYYPNHTPHDCRHTFSRLCEQYGVNENDRRRMLGHSFGADITNGTYGHRTVEQLRNEIIKIKAPI